MRICLEGGGPVSDIPGPAQSVCRLGQVQVPGDHGGVLRGAPIQEAPADILEAAHNVGKGGWLLRNGITGSVRGDAGRSAISHHI